MTVKATFCVLCLEDLDDEGNCSNRELEKELLTEAFKRAYLEPNNLGISLVKKSSEIS